MKKLGEVLAQLTGIQIQFVTARLTTKSDADAARNIGIIPDVAYKWDNIALVREAVQLAHIDSLEFAKARLKGLVNEAINVVEDELKNTRGSSNRLRAAETILDRMGLPRGVDLTTGGKSFVLSEEERADSMAKLAEVLTSKMLGTTDGGWDVMDAEIETTVAGITESSG